MRPFDPVKEALQKYMPKFDVDAVRLMLASLLANHFDYDRVWLLMIAPAGSGKSTVIKPLENLKILPGQKRGAAIVSELSPKTLLSGYTGREDPSMLKYLGPICVLLIPELGLILSARPDDKTQILAQFKQLYDGYVHKYVGNVKGPLAWEGTAVIIGGMTPVIDKYTTLEGALGERFLKIRFGGTAQWEDVRKSLDDPNATTRTRTALRAAYQTCIYEAGIILEKEEIEISPTTKNKITDFALLTAFLRTTVHRDRSSKEIDLPVLREEAFRLSKVFLCLAHGLAAIHGKDDLDEEEIQMLRRLSLDCTLEPRRSVFLNLLDNKQHDVTDFNTAVGKQAIKRQLGDLVALKLVVTKKEDKKILYSLSEEARGYLSSTVPQSGGYT